jgi:hypothetical protein
LEVIEKKSKTCYFNALVNIISIKNRGKTNL